MTSITIITFLDIIFIDFFLILLENITKTICTIYSTNIINTVNATYLKASIYSKYRLSSSVLLILPISLNPLALTIKL